MSIKKRTQEDVINYIKNNASNGKLQESLMDIANSVGYSNATIHRALKSLQEQGVIEVLESQQPTKPNTIVYNGPIQDTNDILVRGVELMNEIQKLSAQVSEYVHESNRVIQGLKEQGEQQQQQKQSDLESRVKEVVDMPDGKHLMMIVRKETDQEADMLRSSLMALPPRMANRQFEAQA